MKYQSEIIAEIVEKRGHEKSSLHYESECKETWIKENEGAYPKLTDYEGEWLNYINENPIGKFPYQSLTDVTDATVENVVPYAYKSAILKGNTMVNLVTNVTSNNVGNYTNSPCRINVIRNLQNETLTIIFNVISLEIPDGADGILRIGGGWSGAIRHKPTVGINKVLYNCTQQSNNWLGVFSNSSSYEAGQRISISEVIVLEGDHTQEDIHYFEGMQSVKMPVLTTTGKNMLDTNQNLYVGYDLINVSDEKDKSYRRTQRNFIKKGTYTITCNNEDYVIRVTVSSASSPNVKTFDSAKPGTNYRKSVKLTLDEDSLYVINFKKNITGVIIDEINLSMLNVQTEESPTATSYEPYKTNILSTNEDVVLRGIGDVKDTLDCLTGEVTERIGEIVLNGSENYSRYNSACETVYGFSTALQTNSNEVNTALSDKLPVKRGNSVSTLDEEGIFFRNDLSVMYLKISKNKLADGNPSTLKAWLADNNITFIHQLKEKPVKTVDLTTVNENGEHIIFKPIEGTMHISTSGETIKPTFSGEIPVEATTQNLASFIEE